MTEVHRYSAESRRHIDKVHRGFLAFGIVVLLLTVVSLTPLVADMERRTGLLMLLPVVAISLYALYTAARHSVRVWRRREVRLLWLATFLLFAAYVINSAWWRTLIGLLFAALTIGLTVWWYRFERR